VQVLVAEDDRDIGALIVRYLHKNSWSSHLVSSGTDALAYVRENPVDLVVLDLMLPGMSGLDVCRALRADPKTAAVPIIMVTAKVDERDRIAGLELGADDYVSKPFSPNELMARVKALVRRTSRGGTEQKSLQYGDLRMDLSTHVVLLGDQEVKLTAKEFLLLRYLLQHRGRVLSRDLLLHDVWGYQYAGGTRTVDVHVRRLREKIPLLVESLVTVKQFGYRLTWPLSPVPCPLRRSR
jgi:DNA-binding response OmpR family regulator